MTMGTTLQWLQWRNLSHGNARTWICSGSNQNESKELSWTIQLEVHNGPSLKLRAAVWCGNSTS